MGNSKYDLLTNVQNSKLDALGDIYADHPIIRGLAALTEAIPLVSVLDKAMVARWKQARKERFKMLLEELRRGEQYLTEDLIQQEDFIYAFYSITRAVVFTKRKEKIHLFAQLLTHACREKALDSDEFEEGLHILEDLSFRELQLLLLYKKHEDRLHERTKSWSDDYRRSQWEALEEEAELKLDIPREHLMSNLARLARTGLYVPSFPQVASNKALGNGYTSPKLVEFMRWLQERDDDGESEG